MHAAVWMAVLSVPLLLWAATSQKTCKAMIVLVYIGASISMNILNKKAATSFKATLLLVAIQMLISDFIICFMEWRNMSVKRWQDVAKWMIVPFAFAGMLGTSMLAFKETTITTIIIIKNTLPIVSFIMEKYLFNDPERYSFHMLFALCVTLIGSLTYGYWDVSMSNFGMLMLLLNCYFSLLDRMVQSQLLKNSESFSMTVPLCNILNNTLGIGPVFAIAVASGEVADWGPAFRQATCTTWFWVVMSSGCGACLGYVSLRAQKFVSGTTILVLQNFNKLLLIFMSTFLFGDRLTAVACGGCIVSILGCFWYAQLRLPSEVTEKGEISTISLYPRSQGLIKLAMGKEIDSHGG